MRKRHRRRKVPRLSRIPIAGPSDAKGLSDCREKASLRGRNVASSTLRGRNEERKSMNHRQASGNPKGSLSLRSRLPGFAGVGTGVGISDGALAEGLADLNPDKVLGL